MQRTGCLPGPTGPRPLANGADSMKRRTFVKAGLIGGAAAATTFAKPNIAAAQSKTFQWKMTNAYGPGSPFYVTGPGSPTYFCEQIGRAHVSTPVTNAHLVCRLLLE